MGWSIGYDKKWERDIGYGVPSECDHPDCNEKIHRGWDYVCSLSFYSPYQPLATNAKQGCGLYFCHKHLKMGEHGNLCERCANNKKPFNPKPDLIEWVELQLGDDSWEEWQEKNKEIVERMIKMLGIGE